jgi:hypothetical protein
MVIPVLVAVIGYVVYRDEEKESCNSRLFNTVNLDICPLILKKQE